jgi:hypothetical protein
VSESVTRLCTRRLGESLSPVLMCRVAQRIFYLNPVKAGRKNVVLETLKRKSHDIFLEWMKRILTKLLYRK